MLHKQIVGDALPSESARHGEPCDDQVPAHHSQSAVQGPDQRHPGGRGGQCHQVSVLEMLLMTCHMSV